MKSIKMLCIAFAAIFILSNADCKKKIKIEKDVDGAAVTINAIIQPAGTFDYSENVKFDMDALLKQYDLSMNDITSVEPQSATITIIDSSANPVTFDILDNISVELGNATIPNKRVLYKDPVPHTGLTVLTPDIDATTDFVGLAKANDVTYHFKGTLNKALDHVVQMKIAIKWHVVGEI